MLARIRYPGKAVWSKSRTFPPNEIPVSSTHLAITPKNKNKTILRMLKNKETTTFHPPPWKELSDQQDLIIDKHRFQILDKSRAKERKTALIICSD